MIILTGTEAEVAFIPSINTSAVTISPDPVEFAIGEVTQYFTLIAGENSVAGTYYIEWAVLISNEYSTLFGPI
jgi:hypothetical protein